MQTECWFQFFTASMDLYCLKNIQIYSEIIYPGLPEKTIRSIPFRQLPCCLLPRKVIAFSSQNDSHTDYDVSPAPSHITFMSVISYCLTHRNSPCRMKQLFWTEQKHNSTQGNDCAIDPGIRILMSGKQWRPGITNNNLSTEESFPAHAIILCKRIWCHPHLRRTVSGRTSLHPKSFCWVLIPHHGSYRHALTERMRIERNNHKWWEDTLYNDSMLRHQKYSYKYFKKIFYCKPQEITWCQYNFLKNVILITL